MVHLFKQVFFVVCIYLSQYSVQATVFSCNATTSCGCSRYYANINARIVGGETAVSHSWGWSVSLRNYRGSHICGGTILSPNYVLTAAHCIEDYMYTPSMYSIVVGVDTLNSGEGQARSLLEIISHPSYNANTKENDIAILYLSTPINFRDANVAKLCLPALPTHEQPHYPIVGRPVVAIGWGTTSSGGSVSNTLRQVTIDTVGNKDSKCKPSLRNGNVQFCAAVTYGGKDTCQGDSGGPLMYYSPNDKLWILAGITSYGRGCGLPNHAGVYTRVSAYINWIQSTVGNDGMVTILQSSANMGSVSNIFIITIISFSTLLRIYN